MPNDDDEEVEVYVDEVIKETTDAFLCRIDDDKVWLPKSEIRDGEVSSEGDKGNVTIPEWLAVEKGLV